MESQCKTHCLTPFQEVWLTACRFVQRLTGEAVCLVTAPTTARRPGLSQIQLADKIDISRTHMSRIENSDCAVSLDVVFRIARVLDVPVCKLF